MTAGLKPEDILCTLAKQNVDYFLEVNSAYTSKVTDIF